MLLSPPPSSEPSLHANAENETNQSSSTFGGNTSPFNVEDEYNANLRTQSYMNLYTMVHPNRILGGDQNQNQNKNNNGIQYQNLNPSPNRNTHLSPISSGFFRNLPHFILSPRQENLRGLTISSILEEYFEATMDACVACGVLLASLDKARQHHRYIRLLLIGLSKVAVGKLNDRPGQTVFAELEKRVDIDNPLSLDNLSVFHSTHSRCVYLS
jgi:hypothetical protein